MIDKLRAWWERSAPVERLWDGSGTVYAGYVDRLTRWVGAGRRDDLTGWRAALGPVARILCLLAIGCVAYRILRALPWAMWLLSAAWARAAWKAAGNPPAKASDEGTERGLDGTSTEANHQALRHLLADLIADRPGVHLSTLLTHLQEQGHGEGWTVGDLRARLQAAGVPVRRSVKVAGQVAYGVHRDALQPLPQERPAEAPADPSTP